MDHRATMKRAYESINAGNIPGFAHLVAEDFVEHEEVPGIAPTKQGMLEYFAMLRSAFPDMNMDVEDMIASGDKSVARVKITATHKGEFMGLPPTNRKVEMNLIDIMQFDDSGHISAHWGVADMLSLMQQLGAVPKP